MSTYFHLKSQNRAFWSHCFFW